MVNVKEIRRHLFVVYWISWLGGKKLEKRLSPMDYPTRNFPEYREPVSLRKATVAFGLWPSRCSIALTPFLGPVRWNSEREREEMHKVPRNVCSHVSSRSDHPWKMFFEWMNGWMTIIDCYWETPYSKYQENEGRTTCKSSGDSWTGEWNIPLARPILHTYSCG